MKHLFALVLLIFSIGSYAQKESAAKEDITFNELDKKQIIDSLTKQLQEFYIRPNAVGDIKKKLNENYKKGLYKDHCKTK